MFFYGTKKRYNQFSEYLKQKFGVKVYKITLDANFSCPNRQNGKKGCIFCDSGGSFSQCHSANMSIAEQLEFGSEYLNERFKAVKYMSYFQSFSNTYKPVEELKEIYDAALNHPDIVGISIGTRPDCLPEDVLDLLEEIHRRAKCVVQTSLTVMDEGLSRVLEPHVCTSRRRVEVLEELRRRGIPTVVWLAPVLPALTDTDENLDAILDACVRTGVKGIVCFGMGMTLREGDREYYYRQLDRHFPGLKERYIRTYGDRYQLESPNSAKLLRLYHDVCEAAGIAHNNEQIFEYLRTFEQKAGGEQLSLWDA